MRLANMCRVVFVTADAAGKSERTGRHSVRNAKDEDADDDDKCKCDCECEFIAARTSAAEIQSPISVRIESDFVVVVALFSFAVGSADLPPPPPPTEVADREEQKAKDETVVASSSSPSSSSLLWRR